MRIAIIVIGNSRRSNYLNGETLRYGGAGGSGTDTSSILVAEYLSKQGHEVVMSLDDLEPQLKKKYEQSNKTYQIGQEILGVKYTNHNFDNIENKVFDILITMLWFDQYRSLPIKVTKGLIYWSHMQWIYAVNEIKNYVDQNNLKFGLVNISEWEKEMNKGSIKYFEQIFSNFTQTLIPNPVMDDVIKEVLSENVQRKKHKFVFHAAWARGGNIALESVRKLNYVDSEFHSFDYLMATHPHKDSFFKLHNGVDKKTLFKHIAESEYFIYPLYTPYQDVHKDTFSCVVAEAIALGAIVVTYPLGALPENFNDYCIWLDLPPNVDLKKIQSEPLTKDLDGKFTITDNIVSKINLLENNEHLKNQIRKKGSEYILSKFNVQTIGNMWINFLNQF